MKNLVFILLTFFSFINSASFSQTLKYTPKQNIVYISGCAHPQNGFILTGKTITQEANNDYFILDIDNKSFSWSDNKGTNKNKFYNFKSKNTKLNIQYNFITESNVIRITTNPQKEAVIEIICLINNQWKCLSYLCNITNY